MGELQILVLALVQGITEFLPISSSGHLVLVPAVTGWEDQGLIMDVAVHVGTLGAVIAYFWRDLLDLIRGLPKIITDRGDPKARLVAYLALATLPVVLAGLFIIQHADNLRSVEVIGWTTLGFGVALFAADKLGKVTRKIDNMLYRDALVIGIAQALAIIPGTSRSGITMTAARVLGFNRSEAARFSMLLSIPVIVAAGTLLGMKLRSAGGVEIGAEIILATAFSFVSALLAIWWLMNWLSRANFTLLAAYRVLLGCGLLFWAYS
ncbi:undecaprenyl-diphosphate phosphatase [Denitrobaculum tricleocarpae]|uniref:Undecaprenyl-diphosphatase n=1 Tax=Denitrobaculum tricleocarpae TaxID=2591009 RepID=A0A545TMG9_9PROT|nr:undecaprenyl-diphosphate phosphatase [Denitrobaculum tricleocarpae]TQV78422.1 undecaprenyl-diphosphate phosphatase [Denitrobaculum tricleocarpae]